MSEPDRYARQARLPQIGAAGQRRLSTGHALVVGCGALGSVIVELLARAGVGTLTVVDRDVVDTTNLHRQSLFDEEDARRATPKAEAAKARVARINSAVRVRACYDDFSPRTAERHAEGVDILVDGLDNLESRYLLNDVAVSRGIPYIYGAAVGTEGMLAVVRPGATPCLRCLFPQLPPAGAVATCESSGVLGTMTTLIASLEATEAIKLMVGAGDACEPGLVSIDIWGNRWKRLDTRAARDPQCPCCGQGDFAFLRGERTGVATALCGRNAVQITPAADAAPIDLAAIGAKLARFVPIERTEEFVQATIAAQDMQLTVFHDGRIMVRGTADVERARSLVASHLGT